MAKKKAKKNQAKLAKKSRKTGPRATDSKKTKRKGTGDKSKVLPKARGAAADVRKLCAVIDGLRRRFDKFLHEQRQQRQLPDHQEAPSAVPIPSSPFEEMFSKLPDFVSETKARLDRIENAQQQPPRDPSLDVPAGVNELRTFFAGACKSLDIHQPTPAIIGRVMHDGEAFSPGKDKAPRNHFEVIYAKSNSSDHLSQRIRNLLQQYGNKAAGDDKPGKASSRAAKQLGPEFDRRFSLIENMKCGKKESVPRGGNRNYCRYLTPDGRKVFNGWPEWTDATGGISLANEQPSPPGEPNATNPETQPDQPAPSGPTEPTPPAT